MSKKREMRSIEECTNRAAINISMFIDNPQDKVPSAAIQTANWFAPLLPITLHNRPYKGVKVQAASKYLRRN
jgi:hypothetical protein